MQTDSPAPQNYYLGWEEFHRDTRALAAQLLAREKKWRGIIGIARGGLIPAAIIARELNIRMMDTLCIASYEHTQQGVPQILKTLDSDGSEWLLIDDLVDTGATANLARELLPHATIATVYAKPAGKNTAHYWQREFAQDVWIHFPWDIEYRFVEPLHKQRES